MILKNIIKWQKRAFTVSMGKVVNVVGLTIESAGPDSKLGDLVPDPSGCGRGKAHHGRSGRLP